MASNRRRGKGSVRWPAVQAVLGLAASLVVSLLIWLGLKRQKDMPPKKKPTPALRSTRYVHRPARQDGDAAPDDGYEPEPAVTFAPTPGHETRDVNVRAVTLFGVGLVAVLGLVLVVVSALQVVETGEGPVVGPPPGGPGDVPTVTPPPQPRLEEVPAQELDDLRAREDEALGSYGWIDREGGVVRIPIDRAMDLLLERGLPVRPDAPDTGSAIGQELPSDASSGRMGEDGGP